MVEGGDGYAHVNTAIDDRQTCDFGGLSALEPGFAQQNWKGRNISGSKLAEVARKASEAGARVDIRGARIFGEIPLDHADIRTSVALLRCLIEGTLDLQFSSVKSLDLSESEIRPPISPAGTRVAINAAPAMIEYDMRLQQMRTTGEMRFRGAKIGGALLAFGLSAESGSIPESEPSTFILEEPWSVNLTDASIGEDVIFVEAHVAGGMSVAGADVGGQLNCTGATLCASKPEGERAEEKFALFAQRVNIDESVFLRRKDSDSRGDPKKPDIYGCLYFVGATIKGNFDLANTCIDRGCDPPANSPAVGGSECSGAALDLRGAQLDRLIYRNVLVARGDVNLERCKVSLLSDDPRSWNLSHGSYQIRDFQYDAMDGDEWTTRKRRRWVRRSADSAKPGSYLALAQVFAAEGDSSSERKTRALASSKAATKLERILLGWVRYGYRPWAVGVPLLLLATLTVLQLDHALNVRNAVVEAKPSNPPVTATACDDASVLCPDPLVYGLDAVIPVDLGQTATWRPNEDTEAGRVLGWLLRLDLVASWALAGVLLASVAGRLQRT